MNDWNIYTPSMCWKSLICRENIVYLTFIIILRLKNIFFKCFAPTGHMDSFALYAQCMLWNHQWKADNKQYIILSEGNVVSTLFCKMQVHFFVFTNPFVLLI